MFRKIALALAATAAIGIAALAPTEASARWGGGGFRGGFGHAHFGGGRFVGGPRVFLGTSLLAYSAYNSCIRTRWIPTRFGLRPIRVNVCY